MSIVNMGRTSLELYGSKLGNERPVFLPRQEVMGPQSGYEFASDPLYRQLASRVPKLSSLSLPYEMYIKTELGKKFVVYCNLLIFWKDDDIGISTQVNSITQTDWGKE
jgi:hypothetical protein